MSHGRLPTMVVNQNGQSVRINVADYDPEKHEIATADDGTATEGKRVAKGPGGHWYIFDGDERVSNGYKSEAEAVEALKEATADDD